MNESRGKLWFMSWCGHNDKIKALVHWILLFKHTSCAKWLCETDWSKRRAPCHPLWGPPFEKWRLWLIRPRNPHPPPRSLTVCPVLCSGGVQMPSQAQCASCHMTWQRWGLSESWQYPDNVLFFCTTSSGSVATSRKLNLIRHQIAVGSEGELSPAQQPIRKPLQCHAVGRG